ncbi:MAG: NTP transferase domain-containing protein, partial [Kineosporiaceae bacterium]
MTVAGLLLAAGAGRRMGGPKALLRHPDGVTWVARAVRVLREGGCDPVLVVVGAQADAVEADVMADGVDCVSVVRAAGWAEGMGASLRAGVEAVEQGPGEAVVIALVDTPGVTADVVRRLCAATRARAQV